jgi:hypothetical protein
MAFLAGCLIWIPIAAIVVALVHWMVAADIDVFSGIVGIGLAIFLGLVALNPPTPWAPAAAFAVAVSSVVLYHPLSWLANRHELNSVDAEIVERIYESLRERPNNAPSLLRLARILYEKGYAGHAIALADTALRNLPRGLFPDEHRMVQHWKRAAVNEAYFRPIACIECGYLNPPGEVYCGRCRSPFFQSVIRGRWVGRNLARRALAIWAATICLALAIPMAASRLNPVAVSVVVPLLVLCAFAMLGIAFLRKEAT